MVGYQLDDEPNLYIENGCFTISIHLNHFKMVRVPGINEYSLLVVFCWCFLTDWIFYIAHCVSSPLNAPPFWRFFGTNFLGAFWVVL